MDAATTATATALSASFLWGAQTTLQKYMMTTITPYSALLIGSAFYVSSLLAFSAWNWRFIRADVARVRSNGGVGRVLAIAFLSSAVCGFAANVAYMFVLSQSSSAVVAALTSLSPLFTAAIAFFLLRERLSAQTAAGIALVVVGVMLLATGGRT